MVRRIGSFVLRVLGDTSDVAKELKESGRDVDNYAENWNRAANAIQLAIGAIAVGEVVGFIDEANDRVTELLNFSEVSRTAVSDLQAIELAAARIGVDTDQVRDLILDLNERVSEAVVLGTGEGLEVLQILGLDADDILAASTVERFEQVGKAIGQIDNEATQLQLLRQLTGSSDQALILLRNFEQINDAASFIDDFNIDFDIGGVEAFRAAQSEIADLEAVFSSLRDQLIITISPAISAVLGLFRTDSVKNFISDVFSALKGLDEFIEAFQASEITLGRVFAAVLLDLEIILTQVARRVFDFIVFTFSKIPELIDFSFSLAEGLNVEIDQDNVDALFGTENRFFNNFKELVDELDVKIDTGDLDETLSGVPLALRDSAREAADSIKEASNIQSGLIRGTQAEFTARVDDRTERLQQQMLAEQRRLILALEANTRARQEPEAQDDQIIDVMVFN